MKVDVKDPSCALIAMVPTLHRLKIPRSGRRRRRLNVSALRNAYPFRKPDIWLKPRCRLLFLEVRPTPLPLPPEENPNLLNIRHPQHGFFQNVHLGRLSLTCVLLAEPDRYRPALRLPPGSRGRYRPTPGFRASPLSILRRQIGVQPIPPKRPLGVPPIPTKWHLRVQWLPPKAHLRVQQVP